ncbi:hypothetical protein DPMN_133220 [Dreissena polymorpha]|uniref:Uncharacterized protein n=1 Tax=Dreissena polymorpha TaxID=45954 RepID=A0A9D4FUT7_DREPO|nr:hypothetical protein DPMN_133220 [Dreissena polymorpha]
MLFDTSKNQHFRFRVEPMRTDPVEHLPMSDYNMPSTSVDLNSARVPDNLYN